MKGINVIPILIYLLLHWGLSPAQSAERVNPPMSTFYPRARMDRALQNIARFPWAAKAREEIVAAAQPWIKMSDEQLWHLMFGNTIKRAWQVWSNGYCPACKKSVPMYDWVMDALNHPWKTRCPHCKELFPKNDFYAYYRSGLDEHNIFDPKRADRSLLYNTEHPDPKDPLHKFGVDDGEGYVDGDKRWRFIGAYLIFGQWKQAVYGGILNLAAAYILTGDPAYAHKAGVLLDRVADLYPTFDFGKEGVMYEGPPRAGYISTWHDACHETRMMALAYDQVKEALARDEALAAFLAQKAKQYKIANPKKTPADVLRNIEDRILRDALASRDKIYSNYPQTDMTVAVILAVLDWQANRKQVISILDTLLEKSTMVDGVTGEKGLYGYAVFATSNIANILATFGAIEPNFLPQMLKRHPRIHDMFRFFIDTWCLGMYYPAIGDTGSFAHKVDRYVGFTFSRTAGLHPSMFTFAWQLYQLTGDVAFVQVLYHANDNSVEGLPYDLFELDPVAFQKAVQEVIAREGTEIKQSSVNKQEWHLATLRSGKGKNARALWIDYDSGGYHAHADGMNIGLYTRGLDLLPDFGYPPVQFGGWGAPRSLWYMMSAAHNTVVVDGKNHRNIGGSYGDRAGFEGQPAGKTTLWGDGRVVKAIRVSGPEIIPDGRQFERTIAMADISDKDFYIYDVFRVVGGTDHAKFQRSHFGKITTQGLSLGPAQDYGYNTQMRNFLGDPNPKPVWSVDWKVEDLYGYLPQGTELHLRYTDLTRGAQAFTADSWIYAEFGRGPTDGFWIPTVLTRRTAKEGPLASTFIALLEPYEGKPHAVQARSLTLLTAEGKPFADSNVAVEVKLVDGRSDLWVSADVENPLGKQPSRATNKVMAVNEWGLKVDAEFCFVRRDARGQVSHVALGGATSLRTPEVQLDLVPNTDFIEIGIADGKASVLAGDAGRVRKLLYKGKPALTQR